MACFPMVLGENSVLTSPASDMSRCSLACGYIAQSLYTSGLLFLCVCLCFSPSPGHLPLELGPIQINQDDLISRCFTYICKDPFSKQDYIHWIQSMWTYLFWSHHITHYILPFGAPKFTSVSH